MKPSMRCSRLQQARLKVVQIGSRQCRSVSLQFDIIIAVHHEESLQLCRPRFRCFGPHDTLDVYGAFKGRQPMFLCS